MKYKSNLNTACSSNTFLVSTTKFKWTNLSKECSSKKNSRNDKNLSYHFLKRLKTKYEAIKTVRRIQWKFISFPLYGELNFSSSYTKILTLFFLVSYPHLFAWHVYVINLIAFEEDRYWDEIFDLYLKPFI